MFQQPMSCLLQGLFSIIYLEISVTKINNIKISQCLFLYIFIQEHSPRFPCPRTIPTELSVRIEVKPEFRPILVPNNCGFHSPIGGLLYLRPIS